jgi:hypothetical protein
MHTKMMLNECNEDSMLWLGVVDKSGVPAAEFVPKG